MEKNIKIKIDRLLSDHNFITYNMLDVYKFEYQQNKKRISNVSCKLNVIQKYMEELGIDFVKYGDCCNGKKMHERGMGYYCSDKKRRKLKLQRLNLAR